MAKISNNFRTPEQRAEAAEKRKKTILDRYGKSFYKKVRRGIKPKQDKI